MFPPTDPVDLALLLEEVLPETENLDSDDKDITDGADRCDECAEALTECRCGFDGDRDEDT